MATFSELRLLLGVIGIKSGTEGVIETAQDGYYDLAVWRATTTIIAILSLRSKILTTENSGHFGQNWTSWIRQQFQDVMKNYGVPVQHTEWGW